jgi:hypothetical protein
MVAKKKNSKKKPDNRQKNRERKIEKQAKIEGITTEALKTKYESAKKCPLKYVKDEPGPFDNLAQKWGRKRLRTYFNSLQRVN